MPSPSTSIANQRPDLSDSLQEFDLEMDRNGFIASRVLPVMEVALQTSPFGKIEIEDLLQNPDTERAPGSGYNRGSWTFTTDSYTCLEHGWEEPVDDRESKMYANYFDAELIAAQRARDAVLRNYEKRVAAAVFNATTWTATAAATAWTTVATAIPVTDIHAAVLRVYAASGLWPDALIINRKTFLELRRTAQIQDLVKEQNFMDVRQRSISTAHLSQVFDLEVIVAGSTQNTADEGLAAVLTPIWSDTYASVCKLNRGNDIREPGLGRTFHWGQDGSSIGSTMETYRDETVRGDIVRARQDVDEKILYVEAADLIDITGP